MSALKSVIVTFPKGLAKSSGTVPTSELLKSASKLNFTTSLLADKPIVDNNKVPKQMEDIISDISLFKSDVCLRGKKRRLDHLTWEEKLQRKKLKNRVAAQTSRDRKKAKLDELEDTVRALKESNDLLTQECSMLRSQNEFLTEEAKKLKKEKDTKEQLCSMCQSRVSCAVPALGSAASLENPLPQGGTAQLAPSLTLSPAAAILLKILTLYFLSRNCSASSKGTITLNDLRNLPKAFYEKLPQKWKQILIDQMNNSIAEDTIQECNGSTKMVGQTSENVETSGTVRSINVGSIQQSISGTIAAPRIVETSPFSVSFKHENEIKQEPNVNDMDTVYGTYDEATNCITIIYPGEDDDVGIQECVQEVSSETIYQSDDSACLSPNHLSPAYTCTDSMSPSSINSEDMDVGTPSNKLDSNLSDCGYESHGSPSVEVNSNNSDTAALTDLWHESLSELFPSLV